MSGKRTEGHDFVDDIVNRFLQSKKRGAAGRALQTVVGMVLNANGGKMSRNMVVGLVVVAVVAGLGFVGYRLLMLELITRLAGS